MLPDRVSDPGPLTYGSGALPIALRGLADSERLKIVCNFGLSECSRVKVPFHACISLINNKQNLSQNNHKSFYLELIYI